MFGKRQLGKPLWLYYQRGFCI